MAESIGWNVPSASSVTDAPSNGQTHGRLNGAWVPLDIQSVVVDAAFVMGAPSVYNPFLTFILDEGVGYSFTGDFEFTFGTAATLTSGHIRVDDATARRQTGGVADASAATFLIGGNIAGLAAEWAAVGNTVELRFRKTGGGTCRVTGRYDWRMQGPP